LSFTGDPPIPLGSAKDNVEPENRPNPFEGGEVGFDDSFLLEDHAGGLRATLSDFDDESW
jgi:hypothetical protein